MIVMLDMVMHGLMVISSIYLNQDNPELRLAKQLELHHWQQVAEVWLV